MEPAQRAATLVSARQAYLDSAPEAYDEVLHQVIDRVRDTRSAGKLDIAALTVWKRLTASTTWARQLMGTDDSVVHAHTARAFSAANDTTKTAPDAAAAARSALGELPGFGVGDALASAVCFAMAPTRLAVYDDRAHDGLLQLGLDLDDKPKRYSRYIQLIEQCRAELSEQGHHWLARDVDVSLFELGRERSLRRRPTTVHRRTR